ncbi:MAG: hypothetical protein IPI14_13485 [Polaromonas sp.]|nr:hypothetical protein [Polaromonas sp.]
MIGSPAPGSRFTKVQIGMSMRQVVDTIGNPNDEGSYITGKAWIPYYYGNDRYRTEFAYKGAGRLIFAENSSWYRGRWQWSIDQNHSRRERQRLPLSN